MAAKLILLGGDQPVEHVLSSFNTLGRHPDNSIQVLDRIVSKEHSRITLGPDGLYVVRDVGSLNGTFVDDRLWATHPEPETRLAAMQCRAELSR